MKLACFLLLLLCLTTSNGQSFVEAPSIDVLHYQVALEPNIQDKSLKGEVLIRFSALRANTTSIQFNCGKLAVDKVEIKDLSLSFDVKDATLAITTDQPLSIGQEYEVLIRYHGQPRRGIVFRPDSREVFTVFSTSRWLVCKDAVDDKASINMKLTTAADLTVVANGSFQSRQATAEGKVIHQWLQSNVIPSYIFGFAIGPLNTFTVNEVGTSFHYLSQHHTTKELQQIFEETPKMMAFFEEKSGVPYPEPSYAQILMPGNISQEMDAFTVMRGGYGQQVLENPKAINLSAHELAHQWWGNQVTCQKLGALLAE